MKVNVSKVTKTPVSLDVTHATLLSVAQFDRCKKHIKSVDDNWWLRTGCFDSSGALGVIGDENFISDFNVEANLGARPALYFSEPDLCVGDVIDLAGFQWTVISKNLLLCDEVMGKVPFRRDYKAPDANDYKHSDIRKGVEGWFISEVLEQVA